MRLYTVLYGNGSDQPLLAEERMLFEDMSAAVEHVEKRVRTIIAEGGDLSPMTDYFAVIDELQGEVRRLSFASVLQGQASGTNTGHI